MFPFLLLLVQNTDLEKPNDSLIIMAFKKTRGQDWFPIPLLFLFTLSKNTPVQCCIKEHKLDGFCSLLHLYSPLAICEMVHMGTTEFISTYPAINIK